MAFAIYVGIGVFARVSLDVRQDESTNIDIGITAPIVVAAVDFVAVFELVFSIIVAHKTVALTNRSLSLGAMSMRRLQRRTA